MEAQALILARLGEIALKGLNRHTFEQRLFKNLQKRLSAHGQFKIHQSDSRIWITPIDTRAQSSLQEALAIASSVFGIVSVSPVWRYTDYSDLAALKRAAIDYVQRELDPQQQKKFKVETRRGNKKYPLNSPTISMELGACLLEHFAQLSVDVHEPDFILHAEVRDALYLYHQKQEGVKGLPVGTSGKGMLLLSGGIDSPVAAYMMASRGMLLEAVYFHAFPYTSDRAKEKVLDLARILSNYSSQLKVHVVDFTETQVYLRDHCPSEMMTIVMRRMMMRIADALATKRRCHCLITGESLGQVASQTSEALMCTDVVSTKPVYRPLIGLDKDETVRLARKIGTFETSILPYEDCCTVFVPKHPRTRPSLEQARAAEKNLDIEAMVQADLNRIELFNFPELD